MTYLLAYDKITTLVSDILFFLKGVIEMSKKKNTSPENQDEIIEEIAEAVAEDIAEEVAAQDAPADDAAEDVKTEEPAEAPVAEDEDDKAGCPVGDCGECTFDSDYDENEQTEEDKNLFALVTKIVKKVKDKITDVKSACCKCNSDEETAETAKDDEIALDSDDIILDDDIIAELREQERREELKKKVIIGAAGAAVALITVACIVKSCKKKNKND